MPTRNHVSYYHRSTSHSKQGGGERAWGRGATSSEILIKTKIENINSVVWCACPPPPPRRRAGFACYYLYVCFFFLLITFVPCLARHTNPSEYIILLGGGCGDDDDATGFGVWTEIALFLASIRVRLRFYSGEAVGTNSEEAGKK